MSRPLNLIRFPALWMLAVVTVLLSQPLRAEQKADFDGYEVHYIALPSSFLKPDIAQRYGIQRSRAIGIVNVSVLRKPESPGQLAKPVDAQVQGSIVNDIQQEVFIPFRRFSEGDAVYYIAEFPFSQRDLLTFKVSALPQGESQPLNVRFAQRLYHD